MFEHPGADAEAGLWGHLTPFIVLFIEEAS